MLNFNAFLIGEKNKNSQPSHVRIPCTKENVKFREEKVLNFYFFLRTFKFCEQKLMKIVRMKKKLKKVGP
jgi:hypothetical protein